LIVRKDKSYETNSIFLDFDWYNEGNYVVNETTEEGRALASKISKHSPYFDFVFNDKNEIEDIIPIERPKEEIELSEMEKLKIELKATQEMMDLLLMEVM
jgi:uncharacterized protein YdcH (DUF465 family)